MLNSIRCSKNADRHVAALLAVTRNSSLRAPVARLQLCEPHKEGAWQSAFLLLCVSVFQYFRLPPSQPFYPADLTCGPPRRCAPRGDSGFVIASPRWMNHSKLCITGRGRSNLPFCFYALQFFNILVSLLLSHPAQEISHADRHVAALLAVTRDLSLRAPAATKELLCESHKKGAWQSACTICHKNALAATPISKGRLPRPFAYPLRA